MQLLFDLLLCADILYFTSYFVEWNAAGTPLT
jgi:hypothetical protein